MQGREFETLDTETKTAVLFVIANATKMPGRHSMDHNGGDVYAYQHPSGGGIAWGCNGSDGMNIARGIKL